MVHTKASTSKSSKSSRSLASRKAPRKASSTVPDSLICYEEMSPGDMSGVRAFSEISEMPISKNIALSLLVYAMMKLELLFNSEAKSSEMHDEHTIEWHAGMATPVSCEEIDATAEALAAEYHQRVDNAKCSQTPFDELTDTPVFSHEYTTELVMGM